MAVYMKRSDIIKKIIELMQNADAQKYTYLHKVGNENIMFAHKDPTNNKIFIDKREIWVHPAKDETLFETTLKQQHDFTIKILFVFKSSTTGIAEIEEVISTIEDIENLLLANLTLPDNNGNIKIYEGSGFKITFSTIYAPNRTLNFASIEFAIDKSTFI